jgi:hypothetical protein
MVAYALIEKIIFLTIPPSLNLNSFLQIHLGADGSHIPVFLIETNNLGRAGVIGEDYLNEPL